MATPAPRVRRQIAKSSAAEAPDGIAQRIAQGFVETHERR
jgi:hypothetical protein